MTTTLNFNVNGSDREIQFVGGTSLFRVWITGQEHGGVIRAANHGTVNGILHAFTDMVLIHRYNIHENGLHLRPTIDTLSKSIVMEGIGYISNRYVGKFNIVGLEKLHSNDPLVTNWGTVNFSNGTLFVGKKIEVRPGTLGEADYITHERNAIHLLNGFDMLMTSASFDLRPTTQSHTVQSTGEVMSSATIINLELMKALQVLSAEAGDARDLVAESVAKKESRRTFARITAAATRAAEEGKPFEVNLTSVAVIQDRKTGKVEYKPVESLKGLFGFLFAGNFAIGGAVALDDPITLAMIKSRNYRVLIAE